VNNTAKHLCQNKSIVGVGYGTLIVRVLALDATPPHIQYSRSGAGRRGHGIAKLPRAVTSGLKKDRRL